MKKTVFLCIMILAGITFAANAEQALDFHIHLPEYPLSINTLPMWNFDTTTGVLIAPYAYSNFSTGGKVGMGFLNLILGLGSYISGEWPDGLTLTLTQGGGIALFLWCSSLYADIGGRFWPTLGSIIGMGLGAGLYISGVVNSFSFPFGISIIPLGASPSSSQSRKRSR